MARTVIIGDVHACYRELQDLLDRIGLSSEDKLYFVGDLVARGPDTLAVLDLVRRLGASAVRGNHEAKLLAYETARLEGKPPVKLGPSHQEVVGRLKDRHWKLLRSMPVWLDLPEHGLRIVHAGVVPGVPIEQCDPMVLMTVRGLTELGEPSQLRSSEPWGKWYRGPPHVVFGHNAMMVPQMHTWATGIDMGCVYGGFLTAMVLSEAQPIPPVMHRQEVLVSVPARRCYYPIRVQRPSRP